MRQEPRDIPVRGSVVLDPTSNNSVPSWMHAPPVPVFRKTDFKTSGRIALHDTGTSSFVPYLKSRPGTAIGMNWQSDITRTGMRFCAGIMLQNTETQEETRMNSYWYKG